MEKKIQLKLAIVEDKISNREQIRTSLKGFEIQISEFDSYKGFFHFYNSENNKLPDILILDFFLERGKTGEQLLKELYRKFPESRKIIIIGFSSIIECSNLLAKISGGIGIKKKLGEKSNKELESAIERIIFSTLDTT